MSRVSRGIKNKKAKHGGGGFPADQLPGSGPRGIHVNFDTKKHPDAVCHCGGCSGRRKAALA